MNATDSPETDRRAPRRKLRVLVAEAEDGKIAKLLESLFANGTDALELTSVSSEVMVLPTIRLAAPEVVFLDLGVFASEPLAALSRLRREMANIPLITAANFADKTIAERSLREGASDYLISELVDENTVQRVLCGALERNTVAGLTDLLRDPQTETYNREGFLALAQRAVQKSRQCGGQLVLLTARLTNLQAVGEEFGPVAAQQAAKDTADLLRGAFRRTDVIARLGENEFAVLAVEAPEPSVAVMVQRVEKHLAALNKARSPWGKLELNVAAKFWSPKQDKSASQILALCEEAGLSEILNQAPEPQRAVRG